MSPSTVEGEVRLTLDPAPAPVRTEIRVQRGLLDDVGERVLEHAPAPRYAVIADSNVAELYGERVRDALRDAGRETELLVFPAGEASKTLAIWSGLVEEVAEQVRVGPRALLDEFEQVPTPERLLHRAEFGVGDVEVVLGEQPLALVVLVDPAGLADALRVGVAHVAEEVAAVEPHHHGGVVAEAADLDLGGVLDEATIPRLGARIVAGAANNQLARPEHAEALHARGILYVPDFALNAGGIINVAREIEGRTDTAWLEAHLARMVDNIEAILREAQAKGVSPNGVAEAFARRRLA